MSCVPGMPCYPTKKKCISSSLIKYDGDNLPCSGIQTGDDLTESLQKLDEKLCSEDFVAQIIEKNKRE